MPTACSSGQFDRKNGSALLPWALASCSGHIVRKPFLSGSGDSGKKCIWLFLWMATIKMKVQNAELGSWDPWRNAGDLLKTSWGGMWGTELRCPQSRWDQASSQWCEPGKKRGWGAGAKNGGQLGLWTTCRPYALASYHRVCPPDPQIF